MKLSKITCVIGTILSAVALSSHAAVYEITPLPVADKGAATFGYSIDNSGAILSAVQYEYNMPVDLERLEDVGFFDNEFYVLEDTENARNGIFTDNDYSTIINYLISSRNQGNTQQIANFRSYITDGVETSLVPGLDEITPLFDDYTHSVVTVARDSLNGDYIVGRSEGVYRYLEYTFETGDSYTYTLNELRRQGFVQVNGVTTRLEAVDTLLGGISEAFAINDNLQVVGLSTVSFLDTVQEAIDECNDDELRGDSPIEICINSIRLSDSRFRLASQIRPTLWQLDAAGNVISTTEFPLLTELEEDNEIHHYARAFDINNNGIAVGDSMTGETVYVTRPESSGLAEVELKATYYQNGETFEVLPDNDDNVKSSAFAINDNNWVVGTALRTISGISRDRAFFYNLDSQTEKYLEGNFNSAGSVPNAINNNNMVVGKMDVEATNEASRETHAFLYNLDTDELIDLNEMLSCDTPYTLLEAIDINDNNEILVNARVSRPSTYANGEIVYDDAGEAVYSDTIETVKLSRITNGEVEECAIIVEESYERQGASTSLMGLLLLLPLIAYRRFKAVR